MYGTETAPPITVNIRKPLVRTHPARLTPGHRDRRSGSRSWLALLTGRSKQAVPGRARRPSKRQQRHSLETDSPTRYATGMWHSSDVGVADRSVADAGAAETGVAETGVADVGALLSAPVTLCEPAPLPPLSYREWLDHHVLRTRWIVWIIALYFHWLCLLLLAILIVHAPDRFDQIMLNAGFTASEDLPEDILPTMELQPETSEAEPAALAAAPASAESLLAADFSALSLDAAASDVLPDAVRQLALAGESDESGEKMASAAESAVGPAVPASAVSAGSFSVWTEPENPEPGEPYRIVIQVRIPKETVEYNVSDLEGVVVGIDGYRKPIPGSVRGGLPIRSGHVRLTIHIVSADQEVEDTIFIRSKMLREAQKLTIRF